MHKQQCALRVNLVGLRVRAMARATSKIAKYREYLTERIDPDTLLDCLLSNRILYKREVDKVKSLPAICDKNERLLDYIIEKDKEGEFINALRDAKQRHLANYLSNDGGKFHKHSSNRGEIIE